MSLNGVENSLKLTRLFVIDWCVSGLAVLHQVCCVFLCLCLLLYRVDCRTVNACARGLEFKSQTGQILRSVANGSPTL